MKDYASIREIFDATSDSKKKRTDRTCAICGRSIFEVKIGKRVYGICRKCQVIKYYKGEE